MQHITHREQQRRWELEHQKPNILPQLDAASGSSSVVRFLAWLNSQRAARAHLCGLEICCGKGRNAIWLGQQGVEMTGFDFSPTAIAEATRRAAEAGVSDKTRFSVQDVTKPYPVGSNRFDFAIDCFGSTDIESPEARAAARGNTIQALKPGGFMMVYLLSVDDEFYKEMAKQSPGPDAGSFIHPVNGKYEKSFSEQEVRRLYADLTCVALERIPKTATFFGKQYNCNYIWAVFQKPKQ